MEQHEVISLRVMQALLGGLLQYSRHVEIWKGQRDRPSIVRQAIHEIIDN
jgi:hypothetical protein